MNTMPWFSTKGQIVQAFVAAIACVIAGYNAWPTMKQNDLFSIGPILFYILVGTVLFSVVLLLYSVRNATTSHTPSLGIADLREVAEIADIRVGRPIGSVTAQVGKDGVGFFEVAGTLKQLPADMQIWAFVKDKHRPRWWPQEAANISGSDWKVRRVTFGGGHKVTLQICLVDKHGQSLISYYRLVGAEVHRVREQIQKELQLPNLERTRQQLQPSLDELKTPPMAELGTGIIVVHDKEIEIN